MSFHQCNWDVGMSCHWCLVIVMSCHCDMSPMSVMSYQWRHWCLSLMPLWCRVSDVTVMSCHQCCCDVISVMSLMSCLRCHCHVRHQWHCEHITSLMSRHITNVSVMSCHRCHVIDVTDVMSPMSLWCHVTNVTVVSCHWCHCDVMSPMTLSPWCHVTNVKSYYVMVAGSGVIGSTVQ